MARRPVNVSGQIANTSGSVGTDEKRAANSQGFERKLI
jgi:hypothetical protein